MRPVPRSPKPIAVLLTLFGAAALGHWLYWLLLPATGWDVTDSAKGAMVFLFAPSALAGLLLAVGGGLLMRRLDAGRAVATGGLGLAIVYALYWLAVSGAALGTCAGRAAECSRAGQAVAIAAVAGAVAVYLILAVWGSRRARPA
jgi:hypothetical protein